MYLQSDPKTVACLHGSHPQDSEINGCEGSLQGDKDVLFLIVLSRPNKQVCCRL